MHNYLNKYQSKIKTQPVNWYLDFLIDPSFQWVIRPFVLLSENDKPVKSNLRTNESIQKIGTCQGDDCTTNCLLDYNYFNKYYKMIAIDLSKRQVLDFDPKEK